MKFNREVAYYAKQIVDDVALGSKSPEDGVLDIRQVSKKLSIMALDIAAKGVGLVAGAGQVAAGASLCVGSRGYLCAIAGAPLMAHGANNIYENGRNLYEGRSDVEGPLRGGYRAMSKALGGSEAEAKITYAAVDLALSVYTLFRMALKPESWRLFRNIPSDYVRTFKGMSVPALGVEVGADAVSVKQINDEFKR